MSRNQLKLNQTKNWVKLASLTALLFASSCSVDENGSATNLEDEQINNLSSKSVEIPVVSISADEEQSSNQIENAIDTDPSSRWSGFGNPVSTYLDLGAVNKIDYVNIAFHKGDDRKSSFNVYVGNNGNSWTRINTKSNSGKTDNLETFDLSNSEARYLRLEFLGNSDSDWNSITDIEVYGTILNEPGDGNENDDDDDDDGENNDGDNNNEDDNNDGGNTGDPNSNFPGEAIGLTLDNWKLNGFDGAPDDRPDYEDDLLDALNLDYGSYQDEDYFYEENGFAYFKCYRGLGGSSNSDNPRVELRELLNGDDSYVWDGDSGTHIMEWTVRVDQLPESHNANKPNGVLCFGQIHGPSDAQGNNDDGVDVDDTIRVQFIGDPNQSSGNVKLKISGYITEEQGGSVTLDTDYRLDTEYDFRITMSRGYITVDIDDEEVFGRQLDTSGDTSYFKVGNYLQSVKGASFDGSYGLVGIKNLSVTHPNSSENK